MAKKSVFSMNNFKELSKPNYTAMYIEAVITIFWSILVPTLVKAKGWLAFAAAYGVPFLIGGATKRVGMVLTSLVLATGNIAYSYLDEPLKGIWSLKGSDVTPTTAAALPTGTSDYVTNVGELWDGNKYNQNYVRALNDVAANYDDLLVNKAKEIDDYL
jgi:hypothetical protein